MMPIPAPQNPDIGKQNKPTIATIDIKKYGCFILMKADVRLFCFLYIRCGIKKGMTRRLIYRSENPNKKKPEIAPVPKSLGNNSLLVSGKNPSGQSAETVSRARVHPA